MARITRPPPSRSWTVPGSRPNEPGRVPPSVVGALWRAAGLRGHPPEVRVGQLSKRWAAVTNNPRLITVQPYVARDLQGLPFPGAAHRLSAAKVLLHEFAHTQQPWQPLRQPLREGGAE